MGSIAGSSYSFDDPSAPDFDLLFSLDDETQSQPVSTQREEFSQAIPPPTDLENVREFFQYSLPPFVEHQNHVDSRSTRLPAQFDRHLDEHLRIERVAYLPSFVADLATIAEEALSKYASKFPLPPTDLETEFPCASSRWTALRKSAHSEIVSERSVEDVYSRTMASHCSIVASTFEFELPVWSDAYLQWQVIHGKEENHAIADGCLKLVDTPKPGVPDPDSIPPLPAEYLDIIKYFPVVGVWEFKNMRAGSTEVFKAILEHARKKNFPWVGCREGKHCAVIHPPKSGQILKRWSKMGPDACESDAVFPCAMPPPPEKCLAASDMAHAMHMLQQAAAELVKHDATLGCLNAGHSEVYLRRDRKNKVLFVSDVVSTEAPGHARLVTGLFIAMLRDAKQRCAASPATWPTWCDTSPFESANVVLSPQDILAATRTRQWLSLTPTEKKSLTSSFCPQSPYLRSSQAAAAEAVFELDSPVISITIPPQRHTSKGILSIDGNVFPGISGYYSNFVVVKSANQERALERLWNEYQTYRGLAAASVTCIPDLLGLFTHVNSKRNVHLELRYTTLVIEDVGSESLEDRWKRDGKIPEHLARECLGALKQIHAADYCYGELALSDIIIRPIDTQREDRCIVSFVSLGGAYQVKTPWRKDKESQTLEELLKNPLKHRLAREDLHNEDLERPRITEKYRLFNLPHSKRCSLPGEKDP